MTMRAQEGDRDQQQQQQDVRNDFRCWLTAHWDPGHSLLEWRRILVESGWSRPSWPRRFFGRDLPTWADAIVAAELVTAGAVGGPISAANKLAALTIRDHGPETARERFLRRALTGEDSWCQLFSEPGAGSDLAGLTASAVRDGDQWIVNGQKLWTTSADHADLGMILVRTNWDVPKHRGITFLVLPMRQHGVEVRPLVQMNRHRSFNEVFLDDAYVPADHLVGEEGAGWDAAMTTLANERQLASMVRPAYPRRSAGRAIAEAIDEAEEYFKTYEWYPQRAGRLDIVFDEAAQRRETLPADVRDLVAQLATLQRLDRWTRSRADAARHAGRSSGAEGSIGKLMLSRIARLAADVHSRLYGAYAQLEGADGAHDGIVSEILLSVPAQSIAGGTDEIQRNILAERVLGLPREPSADRDAPFRDVPRNA